MTPRVSSSGGEFRAPLVPALPVFVAFVNIYLMTSLSLLTWLLFGVWMSLGKVPLSDLSPWIYVCLSVGLSVSALQAAVWGSDVPGKVPLSDLSLWISVCVCLCSSGCCLGPGCL